VVKASLGTVVEAQTVILVWYEVFIKSGILWAFHMLLRRGQRINTGAVDFRGTGPVGCLAINEAVLHALPVLAQFVQEHPGWAL